MRIAGPRRDLRALLACGMLRRLGFLQQRMHARGATTACCSWLNCIVIWISGSTTRAM